MKLVLFDKKDKGVNTNIEPLPEYLFKLRKHPSFLIAAIKKCVIIVKHKGTGFLQSNYFKAKFLD